MDHELSARIERRRRELVAILESLPPQEATGDMDELVHELRTWQECRVSSVSPAGRPEIGQPINVRLGDDLLAAIDAKADRLGYSRAQTIRMLLEDVMASEMSSD
jgi:predicted DNA binding CopG/RHH family protein